MEGTFSIRPATPEDVPAIAEIERRVHKSPWSGEGFIAELSKPYARVLVMTDDETDSRIAGYIVYTVLMNEAQILNIVVDLPFRGTGIAVRLMQVALKESMNRGAQKMMLEVRKSNLPAVHLYQKLSFAITHVRKGFYSDGEDAYVMELPLVEDGIRF